MHARVVLLQDTITRAQLLRAVQDGAWFAFLAYSDQNKACDGTVDSSGVRYVHSCLLQQTGACCKTFEQTSRHTANSEATDRQYTSHGARVQLQRVRNAQQQKSEGVLPMWYGQERLGLLSMWQGSSIESHLLRRLSNVMEGSGECGHRTSQE